MVSKVYFRNVMEMNFNDDSECCICMDAFPSRIINCRHRFCRRCIVTILTEFERPSCPNCRGEILGMTSLQDSDDEMDVIQLLKLNRKVMYRQRMMEFAVQPSRFTRKKVLVLAFATVFFVVVFILLVSNKSRRLMPASEDHKYQYRFDFDDNYGRYLNTNL